PGPTLRRRRMPDRTAQARRDHRARADRRARVPPPDAVLPRSRGQPDRDLRRVLMTLAPAEAPSPCDAIMGRIPGDDLATPATEHRPRPMRTNSLTSTNVGDSRPGIDGDLLRDEEIVGSNPATAGVEPRPSDFQSGLDAVAGSPPVDG